VSRHRHRTEPVRRFLPRFLHLPHLPFLSRLTRFPRLARFPRLTRPVIVIGSAAVLLGVTLGVSAWWNDGSAPTARTVLLVSDGPQDSALALRGSDRANRDKARQPATTATPTPTVVGQLWATTDVIIRSGPSTDDDRIGTLRAITQIDVTGVTEQGWTQVVTDGRLGWIKSTYLSETEPEPEPTGVSDAACSISPQIEADLTANARAVYRAVCAAYGDTVSSFIGYRAGDSGDHGSGRAVDIMVSGDPGWDIAHYVQAHAGELGVTYVIYQQKIWMAGNPTSAWKLMEDRGSTTANHYDHVHVSVS
jgi:uncharacterized protein YraI